jgi:hypothetical protein
MAIFSRPLSTQPSTWSIVHPQSSPVNFCWSSQAVILGSELHVTHDHILLSDGSGSLLYSLTSICTPRVARAA